MMLNRALLWVTALFIALAGLGAQAMPVHYEQGALTAEAAVIEGTEQLESGVTEAVDVRDFHLLGPVEGGILIFADGRYMAVDAADAADVIAQVGRARIDAMPRVEDLETLRRGSDSAAVADLQRALIDAGYLAGAADGAFGGKSAEAVSAFQQAMGLEQTGAADPLLRLLIASVGEKPVNITVDFDPYAPIAGKTAIDLDAIAECGLALKMDDISGEGALGNGAVVGLDASGATDLEACAFTLEFALFLRPNAAGGVDVIPGIRLDCECARRPIMQEILLKSGDLRCALPIENLQNALSGTRAVETGTAALDEAALRLLAGAAEAGELKFRIRCKYDAYDGAADAPQLAAIADIGRAGLAM